MSVRIPIALTLACGHIIKYLPNWLAPIGFGISPKSQISVVGMYG